MRELCEQNLDPPPPTSRPNPLKQRTMDDARSSAARAPNKHQINLKRDNQMIAQWIGIAGVMVGLALLHWADRVRR